MVIVAMPIEKVGPLKAGDYVYFSPNWKPQEVYANKYFVVRGQMLKVFDRYFIINSGESLSLDIDDDSGLLPTSITSLYEIFIGIKGNVLTYIMFPSHDYLVKLEKTGFVPNITDDTKRYIGFIEPEGTPVNNPKLVIYTTKDMDQIRLNFYNDTDTYQKFIIRFWVNHCKIEEVATVPSGVAVKNIMHWRDYRDLGL